jgi:hypothetical protein
MKVSRRGSRPPTPRQRERAIIAGAGIRRCQPGRPRWQSLEANIYSSHRQLDASRSSLPSGRARGTAAGSAADAIPGSSQGDRAFAANGPAQRDREPVPTQPAVVAATIRRPYGTPPTTNNSSRALAGEPDTARG